MIRRAAALVLALVGCNGSSGSDAGPDASVDASVDSTAPADTGADSNCTPKGGMCTNAFTCCNHGCATILGDEFGVCN